MGDCVEWSGEEGSIALFLKDTQPQTVHLGHSHRTISLPLRILVRIIGLEVSVIPIASRG